MAALNIVPLLLFPLILYNFVVVTGIAPAGQVDAWLTSPIFTVGMLSGDAWHVSFSDVFLMNSALLMFVEIVKATRTDAMSIINHSLDIFIVVVCVIQLITMTGFATATFLMLTLMSLIVFVAGFTVTIVAIRRDFGAY